MSVAKLNVSILTAKYLRYFNAKFFCLRQHLLRQAKEEGSQQIHKFSTKVQDFFPALLLSFGSMGSFEIDAGN